MVLAVLTNMYIFIKKICFIVFQGIKLYHQLLPLVIMLYFCNHCIKTGRRLGQSVLSKDSSVKYFCLSGVLLLNACLTVQAHKANSHKDHGWEKFTDCVIKTISDSNKGVVFLLWGSYAQKKAVVVDKVSTIVFLVSLTCGLSLIYLQHSIWQLS